MLALRSLLFNLCFFASILLFLLVMILFLPFPRHFMQGFVRNWARLLRGMLRWIVGIRFEVRGRENIPAGACVFAAKHQSAWDTAAFYLIASDPVYVLKQELMRIPLWGWCARRAAMVSVDRKGGASALKAMVRDVGLALERGSQVVIFPEGTRTAPGTRQPYHPGIAAIQAATGATVVPVAVNSGLFWGRRSFVKRPGTIIFQFMPALPGGLNRKEFMARLEDAVETAAEALRAEGDKG